MQRAGSQLRSLIEHAHQGGGGEYNTRGVTDRLLGDFARCRDDFNLPSARTACLSLLNEATCRVPVAVANHQFIGRWDLRSQVFGHGEACHGVPM